MFEKVLFLILAYLIGSIPFGLIIGKLKQTDLRLNGSGNIGATNATRALGFKVGAAVFLLDFLKCFLPALATKFYSTELFATIIGAVVVVGHIFPIYVKFLGGKGVASIAGLYFALNYLAGIAFAITWVVVFKLFKYSFLASFMAMLTAFFVLYIMRYSAQVLLIIFALTLLIIYKHKSNIKRFFMKKEHRFK